MKKISALFIAVIFMFVVMMPLTAEAGDLTGLINDINKQAKNDLNFLKTRLEKDFGIPGPDLDFLFKTLPTPGDVYMSLRVGQIAGIHTDIVVREYKKNKGKGWGVIAKNLGIKPGSKEFHELKKGYGSSSSEKSKSKGKGKGQSKGKKK